LNQTRAHPGIARESKFQGPGIREGGLKLILKNRFVELKKDREAVLRRGKQPDWSDGLILDVDGTIVANLANLILFLRESPRWRGVLGFDEFNARVVIRKSPPWGREAPDSPWTDHHDTLTRVWLQKEGINPSAGDVGRAVQAAARHYPFHPVRDYLRALNWDGVPRLDTWLVRHFHVEDSPYARAIGSRYLISAVARIYRPGCKADHTPVFEGPQGRQKSEALRTLAVREGWFTDRLSQVASKDAAQELAGVWMIELAEMDAVTRATSSAMKAFLTRRRDRYRPPYGKHVTTFPRQCVFAGTINPTGEGYLKDPTGARRLWPIACHGTVDLAGLREARDMLWAESVHRFLAGVPWWLETPELEALATAEPEARFVRDDWEDSVREWVGDRLKVSLFDALKHALELTEEQQTQAAQKRVKAILTDRLGLKRQRAPRADGRKRVYVRDPPQRKGR
jgi:predicted P-loop ATPase